MPSYSSFFKKFTILKKIKIILVEFCIYLNYVQNLNFEEKPDYKYLRKLFRDLFQREEFLYDFLFDWTQDTPVLFKKYIFL